MRMQLIKLLRRFLNCSTHYASNSTNIIHTAPTPILRGGYGQGNYPIWLDNLNCGGRENRLIDCRGNTFGAHNCDHSEDAGVICAPLFIPGPGMLAP